VDGELTVEFGWWSVDGGVDTGGWSGVVDGGIDSRVDSSSQMVKLIVECGWWNR
jgi:hypothetical protein